MDSLLLCNLYDETGWYCLSVQARTYYMPQPKGRVELLRHSDYWHSSYRVVGLGRQLLIPVKAVNMWSATGLWHSLLWPWTVFYSVLKWDTGLFYPSFLSHCINKWSLRILTVIFCLRLRPLVRPKISVLHTNSIKVPQHSVSNKCSEERSYKSSF